MDHSLQYTHVKLLAFDLLSLDVSPDRQSFFRKGKPVSRVETLGTVTSRDHKPGKFLKFTIDDGTACLGCVLWVNQLTSPYFARRHPPTVRLIAHWAKRFAAEIQIGKVARVRGRLTSYRGEVQITVSDVVIERDPNAEILHWLDCLRLARRCYDVVKVQVWLVMCNKTFYNPARWKKLSVVDVIEVAHDLEAIARLKGASKVKCKVQKRP